MIGTHIKSKREALNISQKDLSTKLNISIQRLTNFESETRTPSLELLGELSDHLNFDIDNINKKNKNKKNFNIDLFKENIANYRTKHNFTLQNLSDKIQISRQTISKWEKGESYPNIDTFYDICNILKIKPSSLVCTKTKESFNKLYLLFLLFLPLLLLPLLFTPKTNEVQDEPSPVLPQKPEETPNIVPPVSVTTNETIFSDTTIELITSATSTYNTSAIKQYKISFNDPNIADITYNPNEPFYLPYYFDNEKYIDHYLYNDVVLAGLTTLDISQDISLTPVYITYEEYLNSLEFTTNKATQLLELNNPDIYTYIIPESLLGLNSFEIRTIPKHIKTLVCNYSCLIFNGVEMDYLPETLFINSKEIEFINNITYESIHFTAINQTSNYIKETVFPNVLIEYLYIHNKENYTNTIIFNTVKNTIKQQS